MDFVHLLLNLIWMILDVNEMKRCPYLCLTSVLFSLDLYWFLCIYFSTCRFWTPIKLDSWVNILQIGWMKALLRIEILVFWRSGELRLAAFTIESPSRDIAEKVYRHLICWMSKDRTEKHNISATTTRTNNVDKEHNFTILNWCKSVRTIIITTLWTISCNKLQPVHIPF